MSDERIEKALVEIRRAGLEVALVGHLLTKMTPEQLGQLAQVGNGLLSAIGRMPAKAKQMVIKEIGHSWNTPSGMTARGRGKFFDRVLRAEDFIGRQVGADEQSEQERLDAIRRLHNELGGPGS